MYMCQKLWKLIERRQSYCNENRVQFFWRTRYIKQQKPSQSDKTLSCGKTLSYHPLSLTSDKNVEFEALSGNDRSRPLSTNTAHQSLFRCEPCVALLSELKSRFVKNYNECTREIRNWQALMHLRAADASFSLTRWHHSTLLREMTSWPPVWLLWRQTENPTPSVDA